MLVFLKERCDVIRELMNLVNDDEMGYGNILCKCELVDCIYMTEEYIDYIKTYKYQQSICGYYEFGRYAWILKDIKPLDEIIPAKVKLGIWNYDEQNIND